MLKTSGAAFALLSLIVPSAAVLCHPQSQPNPIRSQYPNDVTGTINGTTAIVPIPYHVARSVIPSQYGILTAAYKDILPGFPDGMYPAVLEALLDSGVGDGTLVSVPDFTRIALKYPFVDRLNDGYTSFKFTPPQLISINVVALLGSTIYGETVPANFDPPCDAYASDGKGAAYVTAYTFPGSKELKSKPSFDTSFAPTTDSFPYSMKAFKNVTNQPSFGNGVPVCDNYITLFNSSITQGQYAPVPVKGTIKVTKPYYPTDATFTDVFGYHMDNAFIEKNTVPCESLKGYSGTGPGD